MTELRARFDSLLERTGLASYRATADGRVIDASSSLAAALGYESADALVGLDLATDLYADAGELARVGAQAAEPAFGPWIETRLERRDGVPVAVRVALRLMRDGRGDVAGHECVVEDVTERQRRDELLRRSERMASLGTTLAGVAHELNNPLAAIMGFAQLLLRKRWPDEERSALETIAHEAERSARIVHDLLALARRREGTERAPLALNEVVGYIARTRQYALEASGISCEPRLDPGLPPVRGDRAQLEQVVLNLLTNAEQALQAAADAGSPRPARIVVRTRRQGTDVVLEVSDNGPGIPSGSETRIWDPFYTTREAGEGTGLGLAVVHSIVTEHGGTIEADNTDGGGARFVVRLPALAARVGEILDARWGTATRALDVLVVDADGAELGFVTRFLTARGHAVLSSGELGTPDLLDAELPFDVIICDVGLALRKIQLIARAEARRGPRLVIAGELPEAVKLPRGVTNIARPFDIEALRRAVEGA